MLGVLILDGAGAVIRTTMDEKDVAKYASPVAQRRQRTLTRTLTRTPTLTLTWRREKRRRQGGRLNVLATPCLLISWHSHTVKRVVGANSQVKPTSSKAEWNTGISCVRQSPTEETQQRS